MTNDQDYSTRQQGFTLIEVLVVIGLISIISAISYPSVNTFINKYKFRAAAREVLTTAMQARSNAVRDNRRWRLSLDTAANSFTLDVEILPSTIPKTYTTRETHNLSTYGNGIKLIAAATGTTCGNATKNWRNDSIDQTDVFTFTGRGFGNDTSIYLEDKNNNVCFAVESLINGVVRTRRYNGTTPFNKSNWK